MSENIFAVAITEKRLNELRMLADWQLRELGFDPASVTEACEEAEARKQIPESKSDSHEYPRCTECKKQPGAYTGSPPIGYLCSTCYHNRCKLDN